MVAQIDRTYLHFGTARAARRLASYALFEGRPLTTRGRWFNPVVFGLLRSLASVPGEPRIDAPLFITGLGRSGTTVLGTILSVHRDVGFLNEPKAMWHVVDPRQDLNGNYSETGGRYRLGQDDVTPAVRLRARRVFARYLALTGGRRLVDKYPELVFRVDYVRAIFPDARFIFITRSGVDAVASVVAWSKRLGVRRGGAVEDWWGRNDLKWSHLREQILLPDPEYASAHPACTPDLDHGNRAALEWIATMREGLRQRQRLGEALHFIRYENLLADPEGELRQLLGFCGLADDPAVFDFARRKLHDNPAKGWPRLHPGVEALFVQTMRALGYDAQSGEKTG